MSDLFKHSLSDLLIEQRDNLVFLVPVSRIKYVNVNTECVNSHTNTKKATVDFYIADAKSTNDVDRKMTELAFSLLYYYREAKRMILLGPIFETKVTIEIGSEIVSLGAIVEYLDSETDIRYIRRAN